MGDWIDSNIITPVSDFFSGGSSTPATVVSGLDNQALLNAPSTADTVVTGGNAGNWNFNPATSGWNFMPGAGSGPAGGGQGLSASTMGLLAGGNLISALLGSNAATQAAGFQNAAAQQALGMANSQYGVTRGDLLPYQAAGQAALGALTPLAGIGQGGNPMTAPLTAPFNPTQDQLNGVPGYQWAKDQAIQAAQNQNTAMGLGRSGAQDKAVANYAGNVINNNWQNFATNQRAGQAQTFNQLLSFINNGQNAANQTGAYGTQLTGQGINAQLASGQAQAAGAVGGTTPFIGGINNTLNPLIANALLAGSGGLYH